MKYKPLPQKADINFAQMMTQAVSTLDAAAEVAERMNDAEGLINVAAMWIKMADILEGIVAEGMLSPFPEDEDKAMMKVPTGFQKTDEIGDNND